MKKVKLTVMFICAMGLCAAAMAQTPVIAPLPEGQQATAGQIATLLDALRIKDQLAGLLDTLPTVMQQQLQKQLEKFNGLQLTTEQEEQTKKFLQRRLEQTLNLYTIEEIIADAGAVYQKYISREDVDAIIAFYRTPAAQRLIDAQPAMTQEYLPLVMSRLETRVKAFSEETARESQELLKEFGAAR